MSSLNKAMIIGNLGSDPQVNYTQSNTAVANFSVATTNRYKDKNGEWQEETEWHRIVAWGRLAEICQEYLKKGSKVYIEGSLQTREWEDKNDQKRSTTEIKALNLQMLDSSQENSGSPAPRKQSSKQTTAEIDDGFDDLDDDLPF